MRKVVLIIQARTGSTRLPGKVLKPILGKPMLAHLIERVKQAKRVDTIVLATTEAEADTPVASLGASLNVGVFRGSEHDVLARMYLAAKEVNATTVVRITGDCPLMDPLVIDEVIERFEREGVSYTLTPSNYPEGLDCEVFTFDALEAAWKNATLPSEREHVTPYIRNHGELFKIDASWKVGEGENAHMHWSVDTENDFNFITAVFESLYANKPLFTKDDILVLLNKNPQLLEINRGGTGYEGLEKSLEEDKKFFSRKTILVIGCGSIGARHARNIVTLGHSVLLADPNETRRSSLAVEVAALATCADYQEALRGLSAPDAVIIATPSSLHLEEAYRCAEAGLPLFIEKPLATTPVGLSKLVSLVQEKKLVTMMGQSYRFHEGFLKLIELLKTDPIGRIISVVYTGGQYLPDWHPKEDYRKEYAAQKKLGGGVMFTSMSHALDTVEWLFGKVTEYSGIKKRVGNLEIDVDDTCEVSILTDKNVHAKVAFDFLAQPAMHLMKIQGETGTIEADFINHSITVERKGESTNRYSYVFDPNKRYVDEMEYFISLVDCKKYDPTLDIAHGAHIVDLMCDPRVTESYEQK